MTSFAPTRSATLERLLAERTPAGIWEGQLSSSALSTATAVIALGLLQRHASWPAHRSMIENGIAWLARTQNEDGGWGDTPHSPTNLSTTTLCWVALGIDAGLGRRHVATLRRAEAYLADRVGALTPEKLSHAIERVYGEDRTFAVPILMACAVGGRFGEGADAWHTVARIPFELAALPHQLFRWLGLPMVSYAMPALIAVGQVVHQHRPTKNPVARVLRGLTRERTLTLLESIQPTTGGFLEATPLTSFVVMSLVALGRADHAVVRKGAEFLERSVCEDGSWPIDTNLSTWLTTLAVNALAGGGRLQEYLSQAERKTVAAWVLGQQHTLEHPYTHAAPGGWAWTDLAGGVPDADDTSGAVLALRELGVAGVDSALKDGMQWLADVQNRDGGIPTFCRGWGKLPFDKSCPDLTGHALRAWNAHDAPSKAQARAVEHLVDTQRADGAWVPLWFGNQHEPSFENPLYGTSRVVKAHAAHPSSAWRRAIGKGVDWIVGAQGEAGGWGGAAGLPATIEETALAVEALADVALAERGPRPGLLDPIERGVTWLARATEEGTRFEASPIGLYFARLWYSERLYPIVFTAAALERASLVLREH